MKTKLQFFSYLSAPINLHFSIVLAVLYFMTVKGMVFGLVASIAYLGLIILHEMGHAFFVKKYNHELEEIRIYPIHGVCFYHVDEGWLTETLIFAGGLLVQLVVFIVWMIIMSSINALNLYALENLLSPISYIFIKINLITMIINLLPIQGLDGYELWLRFWEKTVIKWQKINHSFSKNKKRRQLPPEKIVDIAIKRAQKRR